MAALVRQAKPDKSRWMKGASHVICSFAHVGEGAAFPGNPSAEASRAEDASRSVSEPDSAPLRYLQVAKLPEVSLVAGARGSLARSLRRVWDRRLPCLPERFRRAGHVLATMQDRKVLR